MVAVGIMYGITLAAICLFEIFYSPTGMAGEESLNFYTHGRDTFARVATGCIYVVYIIVFSFWFHKVKRGTSLNEDFHKLQLSDCFKLFALGVVLQLVVSALLQWILPFFPEIQKEYQQLFESLVPGNQVLSFIITGLLAPIGEELIFRGVTISLMENTLPFIWVNLVQAALFGIYHMNIVQSVYAFVIGMVLGLVYKRYQNLKACIFVHGTINILANLISFFG